MYFKWCGEGVSVFAASYHNRWIRCSGPEPLMSSMTCVCLRVILVCPPLISTNSRYRSLSQLGQTTWSTIHQTSRGAWTDWSGNQSTWTSVRESVPPAGELTGNSHTADSSKDVGLCVTAAGLAASWLRVKSVTQNGKPFSLRRVCLLVDSFFLLFSDGGLCLSAVVGVDRRMKEKREKEIFHRWCFAIWLCSKIFSCHNCGGKKTCLRFYYKC